MFTTPPPRAAKIDAKARITQSLHGGRRTFAHPPNLTFNGGNKTPASLPPENVDDDDAVSETQSHIEALEAQARQQEAEFRAAQQRRQQIHDIEMKMLAMEKKRLEEEDVAAAQFQALQNETFNKIDQFQEELLKLEGQLPDRAVLNEDPIPNDRKVNDWITRNSSHGQPRIMNKNARPLEDQTSETHVGNRDDVLIQAFKALQTRQIRDLPTFTGENPLDFNLLIGEYERTTLELNISPVENLRRLNRALQGKARDAVIPLLNSTDNLPQIIKILKMNFARKEWVMAYVMKKLRQVPTVVESDLESFKAFYTQVFTISHAAKNAGGQNYIASPELVLSLAEKLPPFSRNDWGRYKAQLTGEGKDVNIDHFLAWLERELNFMFSNHNPFTSKSHFNFKNRNTERKHVNYHNPRDPKCRLCSSKEHTLLLQCDKFKRLPLDERRKTARRFSVCFKCLQPGHGAKDCPQDIICTSCGASHNNILHKDRRQDETLKQTYANFKADSSDSDGESIESENDNEKIPETEDHSDVEQHYANFKVNNAMLRIGNVLLIGPEKTVQVTALFDEGSQSTMIDAKLADELELAGELAPVTYQWTGQVVKHYPKSQKVNLQISGAAKGSKKYDLIQVRTINGLGLPRQNIDVDKIVTLYPTIDIQKLKVIKNAQPRILIGSDHAGLIVPRKAFSYKENGLQLTRCNLGWTIHGPIDVQSPSNDSKLSVHLCKTEQEDEDLIKLIEKTYKVEDFGMIYQQPTLSKDDERALQIMARTLKKVDNRYEIGHLYRYENMRFPESRTMAAKRLSFVEKKMDNNLTFADQYCQKIEDYVQKGYARKLSQQEIEAKSDRIWYLPHFGVTNVNKPGKFRLVMDAKAKSHGVSLNDLLLKGPDFVPSLVSVIWRARLKKIGFMADIAEMFHQVNIRAEDRCSQRFLWRGKRRTGEPDEYEMNVMIFGAVSSPSKAQYVKNVNAESMEAIRPGVTRAIKHQHYVDDYFDSADTDEQAIKLIRDVTKTNEDGGFRLVKFISNSKTVNEAIPEADRAAASDSGSERVLGLQWDLMKDQLVTPLQVPALDKFIESDAVPTKREVLRVLMSIFDPLGVAQPVMVKLKILYQDLWRLKTGWDDTIPDDIHKRWLNWLKDIRAIKEIRIPRFYFPETNSFSNAELHVYCDASDKAYSASAYFRIQENGRYFTTLICGRSKIAPLKHLTVPRLELQACVMGSELAKTIEKEIEIPITKRYFWTDSKICLSWFRSRGKLNAFVGSRVTKIFGNSESIDEWHYTPSEFNAADPGTKPKDVIDFDLWESGPPFLKQDETLWPKFEMSSLTELELSNYHAELDEHAFVGQCVSQEAPHLPDVLRFSNFNRLVRATATAQNMIKSLTLPREQRPSNKDDLFTITVADIQAARNIWYKQVQMEVFAEEIHDLQAKGCVKKSSKLYSHSPFLHEGTIRMKGRILDPCMTFEEQNPIILPGDHAFTKLLIYEYHKRNFHVGVATVMNNLRQLFDIVGCRKAVKSIFNSCLLCGIMKSKPRPPEMGQLPPERTMSFTRPFTNVGLDYFGPMTVTVGRKHYPRYGALFTCLSTRACHVEIVQSLTTRSAIMAVQRFMCKRGVPKKIFSDNATCFRGADKELRDFQQRLNDERQQIAADLSNQGVEWSFIPPASPHFGGCWERKVRSVKTSLRVALKEIYPTDEALSTAIEEVVNTINNTPLSEISPDPNDPRAITPNDILLGGPNYTQYDTTITQKDLSAQDWKLAQVIADRFWHRWVNECRPVMKRRSKWFDSRNSINLQVNDVVIIADENLKRNAWPKGVIIAVQPGKDKMVRTATVKTASGELQRPATKLILILRPEEAKALAPENVDA